MRRYEQFNSKLNNSDDLDIQTLKTTLMFYENAISENLMSEIIIRYKSVKEWLNEEVEE